jgi:SAM-dependent methyltransferase
MQFKEFYCRLIGKIKPTIFQMLVRTCEIFFERQIGLDFLSVNPIEDLGLDSKLVSKCSPSGNKYLLKCFSFFKITKNDSILDIGCGKGSAIRVLVKFDFNKVDGIELSEYLAKKAINNFKVLNNSKPIIYHKNVLEFKDFSNYNYFYLYNPFPASIFIEFLKILNKQISGKIIYFVYNNPICHNLLIQDGFELINIYPDMWGNGINVYKKIM